MPLADFFAVSKRSSSRACDRFSASAILSKPERLATASRIIWMRSRSIRLLLHFFDKHGALLRLDVLYRLGGSPLRVADRNCRWRRVVIGLDPRGIEHPERFVQVGVDVG